MLPADMKKNNKPRTQKTVLETRTVGPLTITPTTMTTTKITTTITISTKKRQETKICDTSGKTNKSTEKFHFGANAAVGPPPRNRRPKRQNQGQQKDNQNNSNESAQAAAQNIN